MTDSPSVDDQRSMTERMRAGDLYIADDPDIFETANRSLDLMTAYNATTPRQEPLRRQLLSKLLGAVGQDTAIRPPLYVDYGSNIRIGARAFANFGLTALDVAAVGNPARVIKHLDPPQDAAAAIGLEGHADTQLDPALDAELGVE
jgi:maltose O-acetyltransferase